MVRQQENSHSFVANVAAGSKSGSFIAPPTQQISKKAIWGLYAMYALVGLVNGFFVNFLRVPICFYIFGPMNAVGRSTSAQCAIATSIYQLPWNFKLFYGLFLDRVPFFGSRRKYWIIFGWTVGLLALIVLSVMTNSLVKKGSFATYTFLGTFCCFFYIISDVAGDGLTIELGKREPEEVRGYIQTTGQLVRFVMLTFTCILGMVFMNGPSYSKQGSVPGQDGVSDFEIPFQYMPLVLLACALPFYVMMVLWLEDVPAEEGEEHPSTAETFKGLWNVFCHKAMLCIIILNMGIIGLAQLPNPALNAVTEVVSPSTLWNSLGLLIGNILFIFGVWIFRTFFLTKNWRLTMAWTTVLFAICYIVTYMTIYDVGGFGQDQWFFALGPSGTLSNLVLGIQQVVTGLSIIEIAPKGMEATTYETYTMVANGAITFSYTISNAFLGVYSLNDIIHDNYTWAKNDNHTFCGDNCHALHNEWNSDMSSATTMTAIVSFVSVAIFVWFQPPSAEVVRKWNTEWHSTATGTVGIIIGFGCFAYGTLVALISVIHPSCAIILGGDGC